jgi:N-acetylneuraminate synthase
VPTSRTLRQTEIGVILGSHMNRPYIVAEIGINHNGDLKICKKLIDIAIEAGCDAVKFQKRNIDSVYSPEFLDQYRESPWGLTQRDQKEGLEFGLVEYTEIDAYCKSNGIDWFCSSWDLDSQEFLQSFNLNKNKIASAMITHKELLEMVASEGRFTFISTGMSTFDYIDRAVDIFSRKNCQFELMHTVSTYPMNDADANLRLIKSLRERYSCDVGYSGHETGLAISYAAVALGATSIERHITLDRAMYGSDQSASLEPMGLKMLVGAAKKIASCLGDGEKTISVSEAEVAKKLRERAPPWD